MGCLDWNPLFGDNGGILGGKTKIEAPGVPQEVKESYAAGTKRLERGTEELEKTAARYDATRPVMYDLLGFDFEEIPLTPEQQARKTELTSLIGQSQGTEQARSLLGQMTGESGISLEEAVGEQDRTIRRALGRGYNREEVLAAIEQAKGSSQDTSAFQKELNELNNKQYKLSPQSQEEWDKLKGLASGEVKLAELGQDTLRRIMSAGPGVLETALTDAVLSGEAPKGSLEEMYGRMARESGGAFDEIIMKGGAIRPYHERLAEQRNYEKKREYYGKAGSTIAGATLEEARPSSTAAALGLEPLLISSAIGKDLAQRRAEELGLQRTLGLGGMASGLRSQRFGELLGGAGYEAQREGQRFAQASSFKGLPQRRLGLLGSVGEYGSGTPGQFAGLAQAYTSSTQPFQYYSGLQYQAQAQNAANAAQRRSDWFNLGGTLGGVGMGMLI